MTDKPMTTDRKKLVLGIDALIISTVRGYLLSAGHNMEESKIRGMCINSLKLVELMSLQKKKKESASD